MKPFAFFRIFIGVLALVATMNAPFASRSFFADAQTSKPNVFGYAWAGQKDSLNNILGVGHIKLNNCDVNNICTKDPYGIVIAPGTGGETTALTGTAWAPTIGYISFDASAAGAACPTVPCTATAAWASDGSAIITGWARACAVFVSGCSGNFRVDADLGSWDGWIALGNPDAADRKWNTTTSGWRIGVPDATGTSKMLGYAWGSDVIGWIDFSGASYIGDPVDDACPLVAGIQSDTTLCPPTDNGSKCSVDLVDNGSYCPANNTTTATIRWSAPSGSKCTVDGKSVTGTSAVVTGSTGHIVECLDSTNKSCIPATITPSVQCTGTCPDTSTIPQNGICPVVNACTRPDVTGACTCPGYSASPDGLSCLKKKPIIKEF